MTAGSQRSKYSPKFLIPNEIDRFVEFRIYNNEVQWRYVNTSNWNTLIELLQETFANITPDILLSGIATSGGVNSLTNSALTMSVDQYAGKYAILYHKDLTNFYPVPDEAIKILSNTSDTFVFDRDCEFVPSSNTEYRIVEPYMPPTSSVCAFDVSTEAIVVELPQVSYENEREFLELYIEIGGNGNKVYIFPNSNDNIIGAFKAELVTTKEYVNLRAHMWNTPHWDVVNAYKNSVKLDISIVTPLRVNGQISNWTKVVATEWCFENSLCDGHARRFVIEKTGNSWEAIYTSRISRDMLIHVPIIVTPDSTWGQNIAFVIGKSVDNGITWEYFEDKAVIKYFDNTTQLESATLVTPVTLSYGDRIAVFNRNDVVRDFTVEKMNFTILKD